MFVHYAAREAATLALLATGLLAIALFVGVRRRRMSMGGLAAGAGLALAGAVAAALVAEGVWWAADRASHGALAMPVARATP